MTERPSDEWLEQSLHTLMVSPYIHFDQPKFGAPGPVDLFTTRFNNMFCEECSGDVAGHHVDREGLKKALLAMNKEWRDDTASFAPSACPHGEYACHADFIPQGREQMQEVTATASFTMDRGMERIHHLNLQGDPSLFNRESKRPVPSDPSAV